MDKRYIIGVDIGGTTFSSSLFTQTLRLVHTSQVNYINESDNQLQLLDAFS
jgi:predicted NBD/HSP70 family sugar kinase